MVTYFTLLLMVMYWNNLEYIFCIPERNIQTSLLIFQPNPLSARLKWQSTHNNHHSPLCYRITCDDDEERGSRRVYRGCLNSTTCKGCTSCVCFGCDTCRFSDCSCQTCIDFTRNAKAWLRESLNNILLVVEIVELALFNISSF